MTDEMFDQVLINEAFRDFADFLKVFGPLLPPISDAAKHELFERKWLGRDYGEAGRDESHGMEMQ